MALKFVPPWSLIDEQLHPLRPLTRAEYVRGLWRRVESRGREFLRAWYAAGFARLETRDDVAAAIEKARRSDVSLVRAASLEFIKARDRYLRASKRG